MRILDTSIVVDAIAQLAQKACYELEPGFLAAMKAAQEKEESPYGRDVLELLIKNADYAKAEKLPCCHDTGACVVMMEIGQEISWEGMGLVDAVNEGVRKGYRDGYLRMSLVRDPLNRVNTNDNTPAMLNIDIVPGDKVKITVMPKGGGSENMGAFATLTPDLGAKGVIDFVLSVVEKAGGKTCPPIIVGVGVGGTMDKCCILAKKALLRPLGQSNPNPEYAAIENELMTKINNLGIGALGMGGRITALGVHIDYFPCHITALPVAVNLQCHASRYASMEI